LENCLPGYKCIFGVGYYEYNISDPSHSPIPCENNTYQNEEGQFTCKPCDAGYYCKCSNGNSAGCIN